MSKDVALQLDFKKITSLITKARINALKTVNRELINLYWEVGKHVSNKVNSDNWGKSVVEELSQFIQEQHPGIKGFSRRGLFRMKQFYEAYYKNQKVSPLVTQISWTNNLIILSKCKTIEEREFYILLSAKDRLSKRELERQINSGVFERTMLANKKVPPVVRKIHPDIQNVFKDTYVFEFLDLPKEHNENDLQKALVNNLKNFLLELGRGFTFIGQEYRVQVGMHDYYIDLLLFNRTMQCLVAIELKTVEFEPEFLGKMNFYLEALDSDLKLPNENPSMGILLCKGKDTEVVEYALRRNLSPALIADYETKLIDKNILKAKLHELYEILEKNIDD
ncbi:hypothetical protein MNBD_IGNAVI01-1029 [hydrothermal vent metagenome]|uniref:Cytoplasmic protein n=1 Tax=hydrothermal vent metagenome TaxID=652676 RepID=A0A3B1B9L3_9ZZZZ